MRPLAFGHVVPLPKRITYHRAQGLCGLGGVVARTWATGRIRPSGVVWPKHGIQRPRMLVRAPWSMPMNRVSRQEAYPF